MIGSSVVPGLPNRWVMPSSLSNARKAERPVMRFFMSPPCRALWRAAGGIMLIAVARSMEGRHGCLALAGANDCAIRRQNDAREEHMTHACLAGIAGLLLSVSLAAPALSAPRDRFFWMSEINKASAV